MTRNDEETTSIEDEAKPKGKREPDEFIRIEHTYDYPKKDGDNSKPQKSKNVKPNESNDDEEEDENVTDVTTDDIAGKKQKKKSVDDVPDVNKLQKQLEDEKKRREQLELIVEAEATKQFENEKDTFLSLIPDEDKRNELNEKIGDDPTVLNQYKMMSSFLTDTLERAGVKVTGKPENDDGNDEDNENEEENESDDVDESGDEDVEDNDDGEEATPAGRAKLPSDNTPVGADTYKAYVDELYEILKDPTKTPQEKQIADKQVNELFGEMLNGIKATGQLPRLPPVSECPNCGYILSNPETETCPRCGWKHQVVK